jgi:hypothetical protein
MHLGQHEAPLFPIQHDRQCSFQETMQLLPQCRFAISIPSLPEMNLKLARASAQRQREDAIAQLTVIA